eukprot:3887017-Rhodomonas_salina.1
MRVLIRCVSAYRRCPDSPRICVRFSTDSGKHVYQDVEHIVFKLNEAQKTGKVLSSHTEAPIEIDISELSVEILGLRRRKALVDEFAQVLFHAPATPCPVREERHKQRMQVTCSSVLRARYAESGTGLAHTGTHSTDRPQPGTRCTMSGTGTDRAYRY